MVEHQQSASALHFLFHYEHKHIISSSIRNMACHQRSASLPYSSESQVEVELQGLKSCISSPSATIDTMCGGYARLGDIYKCIEEIMGLPSNQVGLSFPQNKKMVEEELERSLLLIDLCNSMQENLAELKMSTQELQLVLKRGDDASVQLKVDSFIRLAKQAQKPFKKIASSKASGEDCRLVRLLAEAREMSVSLLESTSQLLPKQFATTKGSKWSLVQKRKVICEEEQLQTLERSMGDLENGAELLFRRLIQSRVSLLNILSS
ncbi:unnamed protein product [Triticum turgidum subsp. durum]|uniref:Uncharacterized protein n=1 Tax=Triticum turgidum subsp. durum TaxID=4567 RepID=A0A9R0SZ83_TRITD|nr:unnamed protein product [Triticum turgidum subsp. durum]